MEYPILHDEVYADLESRIIYEDNHLLAVNKRVGEIVQGDKTGDPTLGDAYKAFIAMRDHKPGRVFLGVPHRLDRPVSGIVILAKTSKALERMSALFRDGDVHKTYWALCCDAPREREGELRDWLGRNEKQNKAFVTHEGTAGAKLAVLRYRHIADTDRYHLLEVELLTGRHHQIRCQLAHIGCPVKGDLKYGAPRSNSDGGICLQSHRAVFTHPVSGREIDVTVPAPGSWHLPGDIPGADSSEGYSA